MTLYILWLVSVILGTFFNVLANCDSCCVFPHLMQQKWHCLHSFSFPTHSIALAQYFHINTCTQECIIIVHIVRDQLMYLLTNEDYISLACITYCVGNFSLNILFCICIYIYLQYCCIYLLWFYTKYITSDIPGLSKYLYSCTLYKREQHLK